MACKAGPAGIGDQVCHSDHASAGDREGGAGEEAVRNLRGLGRLVWRKGDRLLTGRCEWRHIVLKLRRVTIRTTLREALRGNLPLRGLCGGLLEGSAGSLRGFCKISAGFCGGPRDFPRFSGGSGPMLVTLGNCWTFTASATAERKTLLKADVANKLKHHFGVMKKA